MTEKKYYLVCICPCDEKTTKEFFRTNFVGVEINTLKVEIAVEKIKYNTLFSCRTNDADVIEGYLSNFGYYEIF